MSITDDLREYARHLHNVWYDPQGNVYTYTTMDIAPSLDAVRLDGYVLAIADRIDAEHEMALDEQFRALTTDMEPATDESMAEHGWVRLPVDADGEYIHVGDELRDWWHEQNQGEVKRLMLDRDGWWLKLKTSCERFYVHDFHEWHHRHHKPPTVEDVLREFAEQYAFFKEVGTGIHPDLKAHEEVLRQYAAKLRLAGDDE